MNPPTCPACGEPLERVVDLPYGYWEWDGTAYQARATTTTVAVPEFACAKCLTGLEGFHPQDPEPSVTAS